MNFPPSITNASNKSVLIKDFLLSITAQVMNEVLLYRGKADTFTLKGGAWLRKLLVPNYPRYTRDVDYSIDPGITKHEIISILKEWTEYANILLSSLIQWCFEKVILFDVVRSTTWVIQWRFRYNKVLGKQDYVIWFDINPTSHGKTHTSKKQIIPSKIEEFIQHKYSQRIQCEWVSSSMGNKLYAMMVRISQNDEIWSKLSRTKDMFDIWYILKFRLSTSSEIIKHFLERYERSPLGEKKLIQSTFLQITQSENYFEELFCLVWKDATHWFYKCTFGLDESYIINDIQEIFSRIESIVLQLKKLGI